MVDSAAQLNSMLYPYKLTLQVPKDEEVGLGVRHPCLTPQPSQSSSYRMLPSVAGGKQTGVPFRFKRRSFRKREIGMAQFVASMRHRDSAVRCAAGRGHDESIAPSAAKKLCLQPAW